MCDLISRQDAIDEFWKSEIAFRPSQIDEVMRILCKVPSADAAPVVHGEWLPYEFCTDGTWDKCSVCGVAHRTRSKYTGYIDGKEYTIQDRMNYCPNCGAKMDGERKDDEGS